ncbi:MAG: HprK-related kinase B [Nitrospinae bacterium]|nr:HprK-related kinase B [Nitrospinota bacterium]
MYEQPNSIKEAQAILEGQFNTLFKLHLIFGDCRIDVFTNSPDLDLDLTNYFKPFIAHGEKVSPHMVVHAYEGSVPEWEFEYTIKQPDPGKTKIKEEFVDFSDGRLVRKRLTGMIFLFGGGNNLAVGPCVQNSNQIINFINNRFMEWKLNQGYYLAHAAGVIWEGIGIAMAGFSGMGKSTLALHLMSRGATFVSNDRLLFKKDGDNLNMLGVAKLPRINPGTALNNSDLKSVIPPEDRREFSELSKEELWDLEHKYDVFIDECFGKNKFVLSNPMNLIVMLNWQRNTNPISTQFVSFSERRDLLGAFMKSPGLFYEPEEVEPKDNLTEEHYIEMLKDFLILEISGGVNFDEAVKEVFKLINSIKKKNQTTTI